MTVCCSVFLGGCLGVAGPWNIIMSINDVYLLFVDNKFNMDKNQEMIRNPNSLRYPWTAWKLKLPD